MQVRVVYEVTYRDRFVVPDRFCACKIGGYKFEVVCDRHCKPSSDYRCILNNKLIKIKSKKKIVLGGIRTHSCYRSFVRGGVASRLISYQRRVKP